MPIVMRRKTHDVLLICMMRLVARVATRNFDGPLASSDDDEEGLPSVLGTISDMGVAAGKY